MRLYIVQRCKNTTLFYYIMYMNYITSYHYYGMNRGKDRSVWT